MTSIHTEYTEAHSRPAEDGDRPWTAAERSRFAAGRAETVALAEARRVAKATAAAVTAPGPFAAPKPPPIILATAEQIVEFRVQAGGMVLIVSKGRNWGTLRCSLPAARNMYRNHLVAGFRRW